MYRIAALVLAVAALLWGGWHAKAVLYERDALRVEVQRTRADLALFTRAYEVTSTVMTSRTQSAVSIQKKAKDVQVEIAKRLPVVAGACALPAEWRVLHDAAATGAEVPPPAGGADAAPVTAQDAAETVTDNYATCRDTADQLTHLQDWLEGVTK